MNYSRFQFCKEISESHVSVKAENGDVNCVVQCPVCNKTSTLNAYWTNAGQEFRVANFQRHFEIHGAGRVEINELMQQNEAFNHIHSSQSPSKSGFRTESVHQIGKFASPYGSPSKNPVKSVRRTGDADFWKLCDTNKKLKYVLQGDDSNVDKRKQQYLDCINEERKLLLNSVMRYRKNIRLFCRLRPKLPNERNDKEYEYEISTNGVLKLITGSEHHDFKFDKIFDHNAKQDDIFDCVTPLIRQSLDGYSSSILAFGPTGERYCICITSNFISKNKTVLFSGSGKTFTIDGEEDENGILPRSVEYLLNHFQMQTIFGWKFTLNIACAQVSNEKIYDMIRKTDDVQIGNLAKIAISAADDFKKCFNQLRCENEQREKMNNIPSHYMMQLCLTGSHDGQDDNITSTIVFIDLAGYENNDVSLKAVTNVVNALQEGIEIVNEDASIITQLLKLSLNDNCNNLMIAQLATLEDKLNVSVNALQSITNSV